MVGEQTQRWKWALRTAMVVVMVGGGFVLIQRRVRSGDVGELWGPAIMVMVYVSLASFARRRRSAFWIGFVVVGWGWLAISLGTSLGPDLPETGWIDAVHERIGRRSRPVRWSDTFEEMERARRDQEHHDAFRTAGHCLVSLGLACFCGAATRKLFKVDDREQAAWHAPDGSLFQPNRRDDRDSA